MDKERHKTKEYYTWWNIIGRCQYKSSDSYKEYGAKGIDICDEWRNSFNNFLNDMGYAPTEEHSIDRIDNSKGYCKENCRWATPSQQAMNRGIAKTSRIKYKGVTYEPKKKLYRARITVEGKTKSLGRRKSAVEAAELYDKAAVKLFGEYALTNKALGLV